MNLSYFRKDIQNLRGLAIFFVLIFHFYPEYLPKGYLGVDLFFVISGYLITSIFFNKKNISFLGFIKKRIIRLVPPILGTIILCIFSSYFLFLPVDLSNFWNSVLSTLFFIPNFYFLLNGGYFGGINELKPLLHMWSLGVEIQFYIFYPFILFLIKKFFKKNFLILICLLFFGSIFINQFFMSYDYDKINFFMLPSRIWEFCLGSIVFFLPNNSINKKNNHFIYFVSIFLIVFLVLINLEISNFALKFILCVSTSLILYVGNKISICDFFLNNFIFNFLGKISYSLYLIHWPILVFYKYYLVHEVSNIELFLLMIFVIFFAHIFWSLVEKRFQHQIKPVKTFKYAFLSTLMILLLFFINVANNFFPQRINKDAILISSSINSNYKCNKADYYFFNKSRSCRLIFDKSRLVQDIFLLGNSHAQMYGYVFEKILKDKNMNGLIIPLNSCLPTIQYNISKECIIKAQKNLNYVIKNTDVKYVIIGLDWDHQWLKDNSGKNLINKENLLLSSAIYNLIEILEKNNIETFLIGPISTPNFQFPSMVSRNLHFNSEDQLPNFYETRDKFEEKFNTMFNFFKSKNYNTIIKPHVIQCGNGNCIFSNEGGSLFSDNTHLSKYGSIFVEKAFFKAFK